MLTLEFRDRLVNKPFSANNDYSYRLMQGTGIIYTGEEKELPYILRSGGEYHPQHEIQFAHSIQFGGRRLSNAQIREIFDSAKVPIRISSGDGSIYFIGKGFLAAFEEGVIKVLVVAVCKTGLVTHIDQIKIVVSKELYREPRYQKIYTIVQECITCHPGDLLYPKSIEGYLGVHLDLPAFKTIREKNEYNCKLVKYCILDAKKNIPRLANQ